MSTVTPAAPQAPPLSVQTTAGNYFVSNYPPYAFWKPEQVDSFIEGLQHPPSTPNPLGIYLHIPFCRKRCHFCYFRVYTDKDAAAIRNYLDAALAEFQVYAETPFLRNRRPGFVYFGGGTPSYLSVDQLRYLTDRMKSLMPWDSVEEVTFEAEPGTLTDHKLRAIRELGVTRLSLGVENFDDRILEINGRAHHSKEIARAYAFARELDFPQINIDLIAGMVEETDDNWKACVERAIALAPDSVTIYQMEVPYNTTIYKEMKAAGKLVAPVADWEKKRAWVAEAFEAFEQAGYTVASAYTVVKDKARTRFLYRDRLWAGADLLGLGVASFGHLHGTHYQNLHDFDPYLSALREGRLPVYRALTPTPTERLIREFILQIKLGQVSALTLQNKYGVDVRQALAAPIATLQHAGFLSIDGDVIRLNRAGLLRVDELIQECFLPEHRHQRYA